MRKFLAATRASSCVYRFLLLGNPCAQYGGPVQGGYWARQCEDARPQLALGRTMAGGRGGRKVGGQGRQSAGPDPEVAHGSGDAAMAGVSVKPRPNPKPINATALDHQSDVRFADLQVSELTRKSMAEVFGYEFCTKVQAQSLPACLSGQDVMAKAKTGTGKTIAFMIPVIERLLQSPVREGQVGALILSPTRELAYQIYVETAKLIKFHNFTVQVVVGGTNINTETNALQTCMPNILVATPGRLLAHMTASELRANMHDLRILVADEADNLLDMGFRPTLEKIFAFLPPQEERQSLLFSATFPDDVKSLAKFALRDPYQMVDCVGAMTGTNVQVKQCMSVVPHNLLLTTFYCSIMEHMKSDPDFKILVFFPTARMTQLMSELFVAMGLPVLEMHSRKKQGQRTIVSDAFRNNSRVTMFSSDVSARGVDYPDVSMVIQVGLPSDKAQYVHRVGRTARAGKEGLGLLLLADFEAAFTTQLDGLPVTEKGFYSDAELDAASLEVDKGLAKLPELTKTKAYQAWLGFYMSCSLGLSKIRMVELANDFATVMGCPEPPEMDAATVAKMGLKRTPGLRIAPSVV